MRKQPRLPHIVMRPGMHPIDDASGTDTLTQVSKTASDTDRSHLSSPHVCNAGEQTDSHSKTWHHLRDLRA
ncbi:hypothetical protein HanIR_Chr13g0620951 [Helianthus annuus]|nr:hypothetical protein HanIR_Chr13g0620951 [Helianthus annuus]